MVPPISANSLRTGKKVYGVGTNSPNFKGATAVRPETSFKELQTKRLAKNLKYDPKRMQQAAARRLQR